MGRHRSEQAHTVGQPKLSDLGHEILTLRALAGDRDRNVGQARRRAHEVDEAFLFHEPPDRHDVAAAGKRGRPYERRRVDPHDLLEHPAGAIRAGDAP